MLLGEGDGLDRLANHRIVDVAAGIFVKFGYVVDSEDGVAAHGHPFHSESVVHGHLVVGYVASIHVGDVGCASGGRNEGGLRREGSLERVNGGLVLPRTHEVRTPNLGQHLSVVVGSGR